MKNAEEFLLRIAGGTETPPPTPTDRMMMHQRFVVSIRLDRKHFPI